jgi:hypothetical protein
VLIPVDASGAEGLFDAFSSLPGMDVAGLLAALAPGDTGAGKGLIAAGAAEMRLVWRRQGRGVMAGQP